MLRRFCFPTEMEIMEEQKIINKTLTGVSSISRTSDDPQTISSKRSLEETVGNDLGSVVVTTTVVEKTEVSVVKMVQQENEDEGLKVNCSENGTSLEGENESHEHPVFEGKSGFLADERDGNARTEPMDICSSEGNKKNDDKGAEIFEFKVDMNKNDEENVENQEDKDKELADDDEEEEDHNFVVGDFVWGKIKSHPWWPGQIYDPSDASDYAATLKRKGRLLVAYFGDRSFSWCSPSQLKPFIDHFQEMSSQSDSKKFVNAVQKVLEEVSRRVKAELCQTVSALENAGAVNRGLKEGARVPKGNTIKVLMDRIEPVKLVSTLKAYATMEPVTRLVDLELVLLKSYLSAFYTKKGGHLLADYHYPKCIDGLEEEPRSGVVADSDSMGPLQGPENVDDKLYQTRKQKSVAELLGEEESKNKKAKASKNGGMKDRKRKALVVSVTPESDHENGSGGVEEETMSSRQRKKSRYLSPPYLSPIGGGKLSLFGSGSGSGSFKEPKTEPENVPETAAKQLDDSAKKRSRKRAREKRSMREGSDPQNHKKTADTDVNVTKVFDGLLSAALDPSSFVEKERNLPTITELVTSYRSSIFKEGSHNQTCEKRDGEDTSVLTFIKQKLEWMNEKVHMCEESEMSADVKASLGGVIQEVLEKVVKMKGK